jgi:hypothetical protein
MLLQWTMLLAQSPWLWSLPAALVAGPLQQVRLVPAAGTHLAELMAQHAAASAAAEGSAASGDGPIKWDGGQGFTAEDRRGTLMLRVAVANGLGNAKKLISRMQVRLAETTTCTPT